MKKDFTLKQEDFDALLVWLSADREQAGIKYEKIRKGLIRFFRFRGCADPQALADETINRVALKISTLDFSKNVKTITYFYGFATNVYLEYIRSVKNREIQLEPEILSRSQNPQIIGLPPTEFDCLEMCLKKLSPQEQLLVIQYYSANKEEKFAVRKKLAEKINLRMPALHTKLYRIRCVLRECIKECLGKNNL